MKSNLHIENFVKLTIKQKLENNLYVLQDESAKTHKFVLEFFKFQTPEVDDEIYLHKDLIDKNSKTYNWLYSFEALDKDFIKTDVNHAVFCKNNEFFALQRIYG